MLGTIEGGPSIHSQSDTNTVGYLAIILWFMDQWSLFLFKDAFMFKGKRQNGFSLSFSQLF